MVSDNELALLALNALGGNGGPAGMAVAIAIAENRSKDPNATNRNPNGTTDTGLWQINSVHQRTHPNWTTAWLKVPANNAQAMAVVSSNGMNWQPWTTYKNGDYKPFIERAAKAVENAGGDIPEAGLGVLAGEIPVIGDPLQGIADTVGRLLDPILAVAKWFGDPSNWGRVLQVGGGLALGLIAASIVAKPVIQDVRKTVGK